MKCQDWLAFSITDGSEDSTGYTCLWTISHSFSFPRVTDTDNPPGDSYGNLQRLVLGIKGYQPSAPLGIPPLVQLAGKRTRLAVDVSFNVGVQSDFTLPL